MSVIDDPRTGNARCAENFEGPLPLPPAKEVAVVAPGVLRRAGEAAAVGRADREQPVRPAEGVGAGVFVLDVAGGKLNAVI